MMYRVVLFLFGLILGGAAYAQTGSFISADSTPSYTFDYSKVGEKKDFDMGKLESEFNTRFDEVKGLCSSDAIKDRPWADITYYARRMAYYAGHPFFEDATGIKREWVSTVSKALFLLANRKVEYERAIDFRKHDAPPFLKGLLEGRAKLSEFMKKPEKVEKKKDEIKTETPKRPSDPGKLPQRKRSEVQGKSPAVQTK